MLARMLRYPYTNTRARALATRYLTPVELEELSALPTRQAVCARLIEKGLIDDATSSDAERHLRESLLRLGADIASWLPDREAGFLLAYLGRWDIDNLRTTLRGMAAEIGPDRWGSLLVDTDAIHGVPIDRLIRVREMKDLFALLEDHPCRSLLTESLRSPSDRRQAWLEIALDRLYFTILARHIRALRPADRDGVKELVGLRVDLDCWQALVRHVGKANSPELLGEELFSLGLSFPLERCRRALSAREVRETVAALFPVRGAVDPFSHLGEVVLLRRLVRQAREALRAPPFDLTVSLAAILLKEMEVRDVEAILSGVRLYRDPDRIRSVLVSLGH